MRLLEKKRKGVQSGTHNHKIRNYPTLHTAVVCVREIWDKIQQNELTLKKPSIVRVVEPLKWFDLSAVSILSMPLTMMTIFQLLGKRSYPLSRPLWRATCLEGVIEGHGTKYRQTLD